MERCQSGRMGPPRKRKCPRGHRGFKSHPLRHAVLAQLVELPTLNRTVRGSKPRRGTTWKDAREAESARLESGAGASPRGFESLSFRTFNILVPSSSGQDNSPSSCRHGFEPRWDCSEQPPGRPASPVMSETSGMANRSEFGKPTTGVLPLRPPPFGATGPAGVAPGSGNRRSAASHIPG